MVTKFHSFLLKKKEQIILGKQNLIKEKMKKNRNIKQGEVYMVNLSDSIEHEQSGVRPCVVISVNARNESSDNVFIFPITHSTKKKNQPCHYKLYKESYPFFTYKENTVLCEEGRSISKKD